MLWRNCITLIHSTAQTQNPFLMNHEKGVRINRSWYALNLARHDFRDALQVPLPCAEAILVHPAVRLEGLMC